MSALDVDSMLFCRSMELLEHWSEHPPMSESLEVLLNAYTERRPGSSAPRESDDYRPEKPGSSMDPQQMAANMNAMGQGMGYTAVRPASALPPAVRAAIEKYEASRKPS